MPCRDYGSDDYGGSSTYGAIALTEYNMLKERTDMLARTACTAIRALRDGQSYADYMKKNSEAKAWFDKHEDADRKEQLKKTALSKLTEEEKRALGLTKKKL
jgi:hypothetical protein